VPARKPVNFSLLALPPTSSNTLVLLVKQIGCPLICKVVGEKDDGLASGAVAERIVARRAIVGRNGSREFPYLRIGGIVPRPFIHRALKANDPDVTADNVAEHAVIAMSLKNLSYPPHGPGSAELPH
jgi:hypothetical protein